MSEQNAESVPQQPQYAQEEIQAAIERVEDGQRQAVLNYLSNQVLTQDIELTRANSEVVRLIAENQALQDKLLLIEQEQFDAILNREKSADVEVPVITDVEPESSR